jgi:hypothetical protein
MNGLELLIGMAIVSSVAFVWSRIAIYKQKAKYWKDNCYIAMEKYNNLLVEKQMGEAIEKVFDNNKLNIS